MRKDPNKSAVSNGTKLLPGSADGRSRFARRYRDLYAAIGEDLGGADRLSILQQQLIRRAAAIAARCEQAEADLAAGRAIDSERFASDVALLVRVSRQLGLERIARDVSGGPTLQEYLARRAAEQPPLIDDDDEGEPAVALPASDESSTAPQNGHADSRG